MGDTKRATERLYRAAEGGAGWELAVAAGDPIPDDAKDLKTLSELRDMGGDEGVVESLARSEERATAARATGDTYDRRALEEGLPTEAEQKVAEAAAAKGVDAPDVERPKTPDAHLVTGPGGAKIVAGNPEPGSVVRDARADEDAPTPTPATKGTKKTR